MLRELLEKITEMSRKDARIIESEATPDGSYYLDVGDGKPQLVATPRPRRYTATTLTGFSDLVLAVAKSHQKDSDAPLGDNVLCTVGQNKIVATFNENVDNLPQDTVSMAIHHSAAIGTLSEWYRDGGYKITQRDLVWTIASTFRDCSVDEWFLPAIRTMKVRRTDESIIEVGRESRTIDEGLHDRAEPKGTSTDEVVFVCPTLEHFDNYMEPQARVRVSIRWQPGDMTLVLRPSGRDLDRAFDDASSAIAAALRTKFGGDITTIESARTYRQ